MTIPGFLAPKPDGAMCPHLIKHKWQVFMLVEHEKCPGNEAAVSEIMEQWNYRIMEWFG